MHAYILYIKVLHFQNCGSFKSYMQEVGRQQMMARSQRVPHDDFSLLLLYCYSLLQFERENQNSQGGQFCNQIGSWANQFSLLFWFLGGHWGGMGVTDISHSLIQILKNHWTGWKKRFALPFEMKEDHIEGCLTEDRGRGWRASCVGKNWVRM